MILSPMIYFPVSRLLLLHLSIMIYVKENGHVVIYMRQYIFLIMRTSPKKIQNFKYEVLYAQNKNLKLQILKFCIVKPYILSSTKQKFVF